MQIDEVFLQEHSGEVAGLRGGPGSSSGLEGRTGEVKRHENVPAGTFRGKCALAKLEKCSCRNIVEKPVYIA